MFLVQLLLPLADPDGRPFPRSVFERVRDELTEHFGGVTAYSRAPAQGLWRDPAGGVAQDDVLIVEVMCDALERSFWSSYRAKLAAELKQKELVVRAMPVEML